MFTLNNPRMDPTALLQSWKSSNIRYAIFQVEMGKNGVRHYQGYIELAHSKRFDLVKKLVPGAHIERRRGTQAQARDYSRKEETRVSGPYEYGVFTEQKPGSRNDLQDAVDSLADHRDLTALATEHPSTFVKYHRGFQRYLEVTAGGRTSAPEVFLFYGATGTGKTRDAMSTNPDYFRKHPDTRWFDGYTGQQCLLLDDFGGASSKMSLNYVLQLLDRYPFSVEVKGGHTNLLSTTIIVTTNVHPYLWYDYSKRKTQFAALCRRFTAVYYFTDEPEPMKVDKDYFFNEYSEDCNEEQYIRIAALPTPDQFQEMDTSDSTFENSYDSDLEDPEPKRKRPRFIRSKNFVDLSVIIPNTQ